MSSVELETLHQLIQSSAMVNTPIPIHKVLLWSRLLDFNRLRGARVQVFSGFGGSNPRLDTSHRSKSKLETLKPLILKPFLKPSNPERLSFACS